MLKGRFPFRKGGGVMEQVVEVVTLTFGFFDEFFDLLSLEDKVHFHHV